ncbi:MAG: ion channel [Thermoanaerobaculia bacterium]
MPEPDRPDSPLTPASEADRDLGFGSVVAGRARRRLLNPDGSFNVVRRGLGWRGTLSLYYRVLGLGWPRFLLLLAALYVLVNALFALAYLACGPGALAGMTPWQSRFVQCFYFSVQTFSTVGYGTLVPASTAAHAVMTVESVVDLLAVALITGLVFARFARPQADLVFSSRAVIAPYRGIHALMFRVANRRPNQIVNLRAKVIFAARALESPDRRLFHELTLERDRVTFFPLSWTVVHPIDADSPLDGWTAEMLTASDAEILILLTGFDETFSQTVHTRSSYKAHEILWGHRFAPLLEDTGPEAPLAIDVRRIHDVEPAALPPTPSLDA